MRPSYRKVIFRWRGPKPKSPKSQLPKNSATAEMDGSLFSIPRHFSQPPPIQDPVTTETSLAQQETVTECLPLLNGIDDPSRSPFDFNEHGVPRLDRQTHIEYLHHSLEELPAAFVAADASRPWMLYWALMGLYLLGEDVTHYRDRSVTLQHQFPPLLGLYISIYMFVSTLISTFRVIKTFSPMQNATGGFGGGHGQYSHLAGTYAAILSLALVGGEAAYSLIDRENMWSWLGRLKQANGGFQVCEGGEVDVRGAYCAMVTISLLNLPSELPTPISTPDGVLTTFQEGLDDYLARCQTYEGGISGSPGNEAHGAYAFCAIACLSLMHEQQLALQGLDLPSLLSWLSSRQYAPEGGFAGRTNKLVDGCYSHWVGGCWPLIQASFNGPSSPQDVRSNPAIQSLYSKEGLTRYILSCCQAPTGGLRDKPSK
jgi:protein farnesyltransferase subunit beta